MNFPRRRRTVTMCRSNGLHKLWGSGWEIAERQSRVKLAQDPRLNAVVSVQASRQSIGRRQASCCRPWITILPWFARSGTEASSDSVLTWPAPGFPRMKKTARTPRGTWRSTASMKLEEFQYDRTSEFSHGGSGIWISAHVGEHDRHV